MLQACEVKVPRVHQNAQRWGLASFLAITAVTAS
jgi:hypothetical protein